MSNDELDTLLELAHINDCEPACKPNPEKAFHYYKQAAELGSPYAQYCVGTCYADEHGVLKDDEEAFKWYFKSARQKPPGFCCAQHAVGDVRRAGNLEKVAAAAIRSHVREILIRRLLSCHEGTKDTKT